MCLEHQFKDILKTREAVEERLLTAISLFGLEKVRELIEERLKEMESLEAQVQKEVFKEFLERHESKKL